MPILHTTVLGKDPLSEDAETRYLRAALQRYAGWNGGQGLLVTRSMGELLRSKGLTDHYTVMGKIPDA